MTRRGRAKFRRHSDLTPVATYVNKCFSVDLWCQVFFYTFSNYQLNSQFFYSSTICMLHYAPQHVSSSTLLEICWGA